MIILIFIHGCVGALMMVGTGLKENRESARVISVPFAFVREHVSYMEHRGMTGEQHCAGKWVQVDDQISIGTGLQIEEDG